MARFLDSPAPFNPINPHGARAKMPDGWVSPLNEPLYRVVVDMRGSDMPVAVTPAMTKAYADMACIAAKQGIAKGVRPEWANPSVILAPN